MTTDREKIITFGDMKAVYVFNGEGQVSFGLIPAGDLKTYFHKGITDPLIQISVSGDSTVGGFAAGETRHNSGLTMSLKYVSQKVIEEGNSKKVITLVENEDGLRAEHVVEGRDDLRSIVIYSRVINGTKSNIMLKRLLLLVFPILLHILMMKQ